MIKHLKRAALIMILGLLTCVHGWTLDADLNRLSLKGIPSLLVVVEDLPPDATELGLNSTLIQKQIEEKFKQAGIQIVSEQEWLRLPGSPYFYLQTLVTKVDRKGTYAFSVTAQILQDVTLKRSPDMTLTEATTWSTGSHGHTNKQHEQFVREAIDEIVGQFLVAYSSVNAASTASAAS